MAALHLTNNLIHKERLAALLALIGTPANINGLLILLNLNSDANIGKVPHKAKSFGLIGEKTGSCTILGKHKSYATLS